MNDPYLYENSNVLRNLLNIHDEKALDLAEAELSRASMMLLYDQGFDDFSAEGIRTIHKALFGDVYDWAGDYRIINIQKRELLLAGKSVWYSDTDNIVRDLDAAWNAIYAVPWRSLLQEDFAKQMARNFPALWQAHPFREGNTRTIDMLMTFFAEHYGYYFDQELLATSAGYVRNSFVLASMGEYSEYEHLEKILSDTISTEPIIYEDDLDVPQPVRDKRTKYHTKDYQPSAHEYREDNTQK